MHTKNTYASNLYINFSEEEVEKFLTDNGYEIKTIIGVGNKRDIIGMNMGGEVEVSPLYEGLKTCIIAVKTSEILPEKDFDKQCDDYRPDRVFKELLKKKLLNL